MLILILILILIRRSNNRSSYLDSPNVSRSLTIPKTSPAKVGAIVWGSNTPVNEKGRIPKVGEGLWCCAVCLYVENPDSSDICEVCDSPNPSKRKDFQLRSQCPNCTFLNGQFANECEMCGEPLSTSSRRKQSSSLSSSRKPSDW